MIPVDEAMPYLLERGLVDRAWVIDGALRVSSAARRNRNLRVEGPGDAGYLIKQPDGPDAGGHRTLAPRPRSTGSVSESPWWP